MNLYGKLCGENNNNKNNSWIVRQCFVFVLRLEHILCSFQIIKEVSKKVTKIQILWKEEINEYEYENE